MIEERLADLEWAVFAIAQALIIYLDDIGQHDVNLETIVEKYEGREHVDKVLS